MVLEFEQRQDPGLAILLDPWLPRSKVTPALRESLEAAVRFTATLCLETCRQPGRRVLLGWAGPLPGVVQGFASVKLLHELLTQLAMVRAASEGQVASLLEVLPVPMLRDGLLTIISTRVVNLGDEIERSRRLLAGAGRGLVGRTQIFDASRGNLDELVHFHGKLDGRDRARFSALDHTIIDTTDRTSHVAP